MSDTNDRLGKETRGERGAVRDVFLIVLGILIAFALDAWWEDQGDRRRLEENLLTVQEEFREISSQLRPFVERLEGQLTTTKHLLSLTGPDAVPIPADSLAVLTYGSMSTTVPNLPTGA